MNDLLRKRIEQLDPKGVKRRAPYGARGAGLATCRLGILDDIPETLAVAEGEWYR